MSQPDMMTQPGQPGQPGRDAAAPMRELAAQLSALWWLPLLTGLVSVGLGLAVLAASWTVTALVVITGAVFIVRGLALMVSPAYAARSAGEQVVAGLAGIIAGIVLIAWPGPSLLVLAVFVGVWLVVSGGFNIVVSLARRRDLPHWGLTLLTGVVELLLGVWAMRRPEITLALIIVIVGLWAVITGVVNCVLAFEIRATGKALAESARTPSGDAADTADRLDRLGRLHDKGLLSSDEYAQVKEALLRPDGDGPGHVADGR
jgi:uncharacterized membrane protein HdeD (DUF308 family)